MDTATLENLKTTLDGMIDWQKSMNVASHGEYAEDDALRLARVVRAIVELLLKKESDG